MEISILADDKSQSLSLLHNNYASNGQIDAFTSTINVLIAYCKKCHFVAHIIYNTLLIKKCANSPKNAKKLT